jgi:hypothetical protein
MNEEANENDENVSEKSFSMDDLPDLESVAISEMSDLSQAKQAPKGFRNVMVINESDSDSDSDSEDIVLNRPSAEAKAVVTEKASEMKENPKSNFLESTSETSSILNIAQNRLCKHQRRLLQSHLFRNSIPMTKNHDTRPFETKITEMICTTILFFYLYDDYIFL